MNLKHENTSSNGCGWTSKPEWQQSFITAFELSRGCVIDMIHHVLVVRTFTNKPKNFRIQIYDIIIFTTYYRALLG